MLCGAHTLVQFVVCSTHKVEAELVWGLVAKWQDCHMHCTTFAHILLAVWCGT
jgi:hypothetical protein